LPQAVSGDHFVSQQKLELQRSLPQFKAGRRNDKFDELGVDVIGRRWIVLFNGYAIPGRPARSAGQRATRSR